MLCSTLAAQQVSDSNYQEIQVPFSIKRSSLFYHRSFRSGSLNVGETYKNILLEIKLKFKVAFQAGDRNTQKKIHTN